ncbi:MAG: hypothetical protein ACYCY8_07060 [Burkholderiales bacterium]
MKPRFIPVVIGMLLGINLIFHPLAQAAEKVETQVQIPANAGAIWQAIDQQSAALGKAIQTGAFDEVHHRAFAIRDLVAALPSHSGSLSPDKQAQVKTNMQFVATLAQRLDATGDARDKAGTESNFWKLQQILAAIRPNYAGAVGSEPTIRRVSHEL